MFGQSEGIAFPGGVAGLEAARRGAFISRTYKHLLAAIVGFATLEAILFRTGAAYTIAEAMLGVSWLLVLGAFMIAGYLFTNMAQRADTPAMQYAALAGYVVVEAILFVPLLVMAEWSAPGAISSAAVATLLGFAGLTLVAMTTGKDFSFLGGVIRYAGIMAIVAIVCGVIFGFQLGTYFSIAMVALAGAAILYETSNVMRHYPEDRHVAASLALFASVALMFWYVLRIFMSRD